MIKVTIQCVQGGDSSEITGAEPETDWRVGYIAVAEISSFYPSSDGYTMINQYSTCFTVKENLETVRKLILEARSLNKRLEVMSMLS